MTFPMKWATCDLTDYALRKADDTLVLGQRLSQWCGHGPVLEQDIALTNVALDLIGQARGYYQMAAAWRADGSTEDDLAFRRDVPQFANHLLVELPNGHWGDTLVRQFFFDTYNFYLLERLSQSPVTALSELAQKAYKEVSYHAQFSAEWVIRLGDGTDESRAKVLESIAHLWPYTGELFEDTDLDRRLAQEGAVPLPSSLRALWLQKVEEVFALATLDLPDPAAYMQKGGLHGRHTEHLGFLLAEMQFLPRAYPDAKW